MKPTNIYALTDPRTNLIRYVGKTIKPVRERLAVHLYYARKGAHTGCARWLKGLQDNGLLPEVIILQVVNEDWAAAERHWIAKLRAQGSPLLNHTAGGDGLNEYRHTPEAIANMRVAQALRFSTKSNPLKGRTRSEEIRLKCSLAQKGREISEEHRERISKALTGKAIPEDVRTKISAALKGQKKPPRSAEHSLRIAEKAKGRVQSPESRAAKSASMKAYAATAEGNAKLRRAAALPRARVS
jgi:hypothetical protein